jgi:hypothetical protein
MKPAISVRLAFLIVAAACLGFAQVSQPLTNDDIVKMSQARLSSNVILTTIASAQSVKFDVSPAALIALKDAGVADPVIEAMLSKARERKEIEAATPAALAVEAEKSESLAAAKHPETILRMFKTLLVDASRAEFFGSDQMKAALGSDKGFAALKITIVDDRALADVVLEVGYTFAWDYPFSLKHQNTSMVLKSGKGSGPFSGPAGAKSVASEVVKLLKPYRLATTADTPK